MTINFQLWHLSNTPNVKCQTFQLNISIRTFNIWANSFSINISNRTFNIWANSFSINWKYVFNFGKFVHLTFRQKFIFKIRQMYKRGLHLVFTLVYLTRCFWVTYQMSKFSIEHLTFGRINFQWHLTFERVLHLVFTLVYLNRCFSQNLCHL